MHKFNLLKKLLICSAISLTFASSLGINISKKYNQVVATTPEGSPIADSAAFIAAYKSGGNYYLTNDIELTYNNGNISTLTELNIVIDLNGHTFSFTKTDTTILLEGSTYNDYTRSIIFKNGTFKPNFNGIDVVGNINGISFNSVNIVDPKFNISSASYWNFNDCTIISNRYGTESVPNAFEIPNNCTVNFNNTAIDSINNNGSSGSAISLNLGGIVNITNGSSIQHFNNGISMRGGTANIISSEIKNNYTGIYFWNMDTINVNFGGNTKIHENMNENMKATNDKCVLSFLTGENQPIEGIDIYAKKSTVIANENNLIKIDVDDENCHFVYMEFATKARLGVSYEILEGQNPAYRIKTIESKPQITVTFASSLLKSTHDCLLIDNNLRFGVLYRLIDKESDATNIVLSSENLPNGLSKKEYTVDDEMIKINEAIEPDDNGNYYSWGIDIPNIPLNQLNHMIYAVSYIKTGNLYYYSNYQCYSVNSLAKAYFDAGENDNTCAYKEHLNMLDWLSNYCEDYTMGPVDEDFLVNINPWE